MKSLGLVLLSMVCMMVLLPIAAAAPVVPGLSNKHPLSEQEVGRLLTQELRCTSCHREKGAKQPVAVPGPDLSEVGARVAPDYLQRFIASPSAVRAGTTMPDLLANETAEQRKKISEAIAHFLVAQSSRKFSQEQIDAKEASAGRSLFHTIGCAACHSPRDERDREIIQDGVVKLDHVPTKYSLESLSEFLFQPRRARPSGRMPDMKLKPEEAGAIAGYLLGKTDRKAEVLRPEGTMVALGRKYFQQLNCASCHKLGNIAPAASVTPLKDVNVTRGCLSGPGGKAPRFNLSMSQTRAIRAALAGKTDPVSDKHRIAMTLTAFNCIACHVRDNYGGARADRDLYFQSSEKELGDEGRIPPPLTLVGAKLTKLVLKKVLFDGDSVRPYMATRMPQFGESNLHHLPDLFARLDKVKEIPFSLPKAGRKTQKERDLERDMRDAGRLLVGDKGFNCIACHSFNGETADKQGIDLMTVTERLQPSWFYHFVLEPNAFRPRTVMPEAWPDGQALFKEILEGSTKRQIEAIWHYLSLGTSARLPSGIQMPPEVLKVAGTVRTYRGRSSVAGYRGIAVGFPNRLNYAFNAETGTLSALWKGDFLNVNRRGQGSGRFNPAGKCVQMAQDLSFCKLANEKTAWPLRPVMTKEAPVNPDPLYPRNLGYRFNGYYMDDLSIPTFMYRSGNIRIEDCPVAQVEDKKVLLVRKLAFDSPNAQTVWFRALTGKIQSESKQQFKTPELRLSIPSVPTVVRPIPGDPKSSELLLKLAIPKGKSTQKLTYELLR